MKKDIKLFFYDEKQKENFVLKEGHKQRFLERLEKDLPKKRKKSPYYLAIAASFLLLISSAIYFYNTSKIIEGISTNVVDAKDKNQNSPSISLSDLSPDLKKVEQFYLATINFELAKLEVSQDNQDLVKTYMEQLTELNKEYQRLNKELNTIGPNDQTIAALIQNLQLRLQLLQKLKEKLNELNQSRNETAIKI